MNQLIINFSLRKNIALNPVNWENCTLYVQDINVPGINITAELSSEEAYTFKTICQVVSTENIYNNTIDEYILQLQKDEPVNPLWVLAKSSSATIKSSSLSNLSLNAIPPTTRKASTSTISMQSLKTAIISAEKVTGSNTSKKLEDIIQKNNVSDAAVARMKELLSRSQDRIQNESKIIETFSNFFIKIDPTSKVVPFGSSTYGFGGLKTNFNILLKNETSKTQVLHIF